MSLHSPFRPDGEQLPRAYGGCTCHCHRWPGVSHVMACCKPGDKAWCTIYNDPGPRGEPWLVDLLQQQAEQRQPKVEPVDINYVPFEY